MQIYAADLVGVRGDLFRLDVVAEVDGQGIGLLGSVRKILQQGVLERVRRAVKAIDEDIELGNDMRIIVDINPPESQLRSSGCDLPIAMALMMAWLYTQVESTKAELEAADAAHDKVAGRDSEKAERERQRILEVQEQLEAKLKRAKAHRAKIKKLSGKFLLVGKLNLDGSIEAPDRGVFSMLDAAEDGMHLIVPPECEVEAGLIARSRGKGNIRATVASHILEAWSTIIGVKAGKRCRFSKNSIKEKVLIRTDLDLRDIEGCWRGKKALEVALAGGHPLLLRGPGGVGKSMLAEAATNLLPPLDQSEVREVNRVYSARGELKGNELVLAPPFRQAGQSITRAALFGGGTDARPGLISLSHRGVLFLDEINLIDPKLIEELRQPMQDGFVQIQRARVNEELPANFLLLAAMNPCKCSWKDHYECNSCRVTFVSHTAQCPDGAEHRVARRCSCTQREIDRYSRYLSGPIKDRIDLITLVSSHDRFSGDGKDYSSKYVATRIKQARERQRKRYSKLKHRGRNESLILTNGDVPNLSIYRRVVSNSDAAERHFAMWLKRERVDSKRKETRLWLVAQTVADIESHNQVTKQDIDWAFKIAGYGDEALGI
jgi:magnesium chelatase family protein